MGVAGSVFEPRRGSFAKYDIFYYHFWPSLKLTDLKNIQKQDVHVIPSPWVNLGVESGNSCNIETKPKRASDLLNGQKGLFLWVNAILEL